MLDLLETLKSFERQKCLTEHFECFRAGQTLKYFPSPVATLRTTARPTNLFGVASSTPKAKGPLLRRFINQSISLLLTQARILNVNPYKT